VSTVSLPSPAPNHRVQPTPSSVRSAPAFGRGWRARVRLPLCGPWRHRV